MVIIYYTNMTAMIGYNLLLTIKFHIPAIGSYFFGRQKMMMLPIVSSHALQTFFIGDSIYIVYPGTSIALNAMYCRATAHVIKDQACPGTI
jgi:hypothetical protein